MGVGKMTVADFMAGLDRLEDGLYMVYDWAEGRARLDGWQLAYAGDVYGLPRVPHETLKRCVAWSDGTQTAFRRGTRARERQTVWNYYSRLKAALETA